MRSEEKRRGRKSGDGEKIKGARGRQRRGRKRADCKPSLARIACCRTGGKSFDAGNPVNACRVRVYRATVYRLGWQVQGIRVKGKEAESFSSKIMALVH